MCPSVSQCGGFAGLSSRKGYLAFSATRQDAGLSTSCTSMICRRLAPANASKTQSVTALTAAGAMPRPPAPRPRGPPPPDPAGPPPILQSDIPRQDAAADIVRLEYGETQPVTV